MRYVPDVRLSQLLEESYRPCGGFQGGCRETASWEPSADHIPRAFVGALGTIEEVMVVVVTAQPALPLPEEPVLYSDLDQDEMLEQTCQHTFECLRDERETYHRGIRYLLDQIFHPEHRLEEQLKQSWITQTYLCSAPMGDGRRIPMVAAGECADRYLGPQLRLFSRLPTVVLGGAAQQRVRSVQNGPNVNLGPSPNARISTEELRRRYRELATQVRMMMQNPRRYNSSR